MNTIESVIQFGSLQPLVTLWVHSLKRISAEDAKLQTVHKESVPKLVVGM